MKKQSPSKINMYLYILKHFSWCLLFQAHLNYLQNTELRLVKYALV